MRYWMLTLCLWGTLAGCIPAEKAKAPPPARTLTEADRRYLRQRGISNYGGEQARQALWERDRAREEVQKARQRHQERFGQRK